MLSVKLKLSIKLGLGDGTVVGLRVGRGVGTILGSGLGTRVGALVETSGDCVGGKGCVGTNVPVGASDGGMVGKLEGL